mgnify:CR=1 FL=1
MITEFVKRFEDNTDKLRTVFSEKHQENYADIVKAVVSILHVDSDDYEEPNPHPEKIHTIDDGNYQGTLLYIIPSNEYQPDRYFYVFVGYGSCSGCDTLEAIRSYSDDLPTSKQVDDYMTLALHIVQNIKEISAY